MAELQDTDKFLVNRSNNTRQLSKENLMAELRDDDLMLVNRAGVSYKATGAEIKDSLKPEAEAPEINAVALTEVKNGYRYTDKEFPYTVDMAVEGEPAPGYALKAKLSGTTFDFAVQSDTITKVEGGGENVYTTDTIASVSADANPVLTFPEAATNFDKFERGDVVQDPDVKIAAINAEAVPPSITVDGGKWYGQDGTGQQSDGRYEPSQEWSDTLNAAGGINDPEKAFNGDLTSAWAYGQNMTNGSLTWTASSFALSGNLKVYVQGDSRDAAKVSVPGKPDQYVGLSAVVDELDFGTVTDLQSIVVTTTNHRPNLVGVKIDGKTLVDSSIPGAGGATDITKTVAYNTKLTVASDKDLADMTGAVYMTDGQTEADGTFKPASYTLQTSTIESVSADANPVLTFTTPNPDLQYFLPGDLVQGEFKFISYKPGTGGSEPGWFGKIELLINGQWVALIDRSVGGAGDPSVLEQLEWSSYCVGTQYAPAYAFTKGFDGVADEDGATRTGGDFIFTPPTPIKCQGYRMNMATYDNGANQIFLNGIDVGSQIPLTNEYNSKVTFDVSQLVTPITVVSTDTTANTMTVDGGEWLGADGSGDPNGDTTVTVGPFTAEGTIQSIAGTEVDLSASTGRWIADNKADIPFSFVPSTPIVDTRNEAYGKLQIVGDKAMVTGIQADDPGFTNVTSKDYAITFPAAFATGNTPDDDLPAGCAISAIVRAKNSEGESIKESNILLPSLPNPDGSAGPITDVTATELTVETSANLDTFIAADALVMVDDTGAVASYTPVTSEIANAELTQYSQGVTSLSGNLHGTAEELFDGNLDTAVGDLTTTGNSQPVPFAQINFNFTNSPLTSTIGNVRVYFKSNLSNPGNAQRQTVNISVNGGAFVPATDFYATSGGTTNSGWQDLGTNNLTTLSIKSTYGGQDSYGTPIYGFEADDEIVTEGRNILTFTTPNPDLKYFLPGDKVDKGTVVSVTEPNLMTVQMDAGGWNAVAATEANSWFSVTYGNGKYVAVATSGTNQVMYSTTGEDGTWKNDNVTGVEANDWRSVTYGNNKFVAVAYDGSNRVMHSTNGINWNAVSAAEDNSWLSVTYGDGKFVAVAGSGTDRVMYSEDDGLTWKKDNVTGVVANSWFAVTYSNGKFVAVAVSGADRVMHSDDGISWTAASATEANGWRGVTYGNGKFVAVASEGTNRVMYSEDNGITWKNNNVTGVEASSWRSVTYGNGKFVAIADSGTGNRVMHSTDGINWSSASATEANNWRSVTYGAGKFVAVANNGTNRVMWSTTGTNDAFVYTNGEKVIGPVKSGVGTFVSTNGTDTVSIENSNNEWISNDNRLGEEFFIKKLFTALNANDPAHVAMQKAVADAFDAFPKNVQARKTQIAESFTKLVAGAAITEAELSALRKVMTAWTDEEV